MVCASVSSSADWGYDGSSFHGPLGGGRERGKEHGLPGAREDGARLAVVPELCVWGPQASVPAPWPSLRTGHRELGPGSFILQPQDVVSESPLLSQKGKRGPEAHLDHVEPGPGPLISRGGRP